LVRIFPVKLTDFTKRVLVPAHSRKIIKKDRMVRGTVEHRTVIHLRKHDEEIGTKGRAAPKRNRGRLLKSDATKKEYNISHFYGGEAGGPSGRGVKRLSRKESQAGILLLISERGNTTIVFVEKRRRLRI